MWQFRDRKRNRFEKIDMWRPSKFIKSSLWNRQVKWLSMTCVSDKPVPDLTSFVNICLIIWYKDEGWNASSRVFPTRSGTNEIKWWVLCASISQQFWWDQEYEKGSVKRYMRVKFTSYWTFDYPRFKFVVGIWFCSRYVKPLVITYYGSEHVLTALCLKCLISNIHIRMLNLLQISNLFHV